ncbi:sensor histidine kinase [Rhodococcus sp. USK10]|uniref:histidine kinase n=1 Tax=Rhodococcus wratislaviensis TaxID=44752 RepID=A0A402C8R2_RHOWR|nr:MULTISPECIES: sensor histidine kinase [Rhodococcus]QYB00979.1 sensor histidine kinase [Rhodococcus sp. USK10]GCE39999.1 putative sensor-like histidine kinase [Rhodococcus wratislaviensis]
MSDDSPPRAKFWDIEGWGLRWKVTAVLAVPVTVAMVLGGLRVQGELSNAVHFTEAADQIVVVPDIVALEASMGTVTSGYASGTLTKDDRAAAESLMNDVSEQARNPELDPAVASSINQTVSDGRALLNLMDSPGVATDLLAERQRAFAADFIREVDDIVRPIEDSEVVDKGYQLTNAWQAQRRLFEQAMGLVIVKDAYAGPDGREKARTGNIPTSAVVAAAGAESSLLDVLDRYYPKGDERLQTLRNNINDRNALIDTGLADAARGGVLPILQLRSSLIASRDVYQELTSEAAKDIASTVQIRAAETRSAALRDTAIVLGTLLAALVLALLVSRSLIGPIRRLRYGALKAARRDLPDAIEQIKASDDPRALSFEPVAVHSSEEIGQLARAVDDIHGQALKLAGEQAQLRLQINDMFETLARRSKSLVDQQLGLIENLEFEEKDPKRLESLFRLDHLAARMRRNGENLLILAGTRVRRSQAAPIPLGDVLRAAISEVEDYQRVQMGATPEGALSGTVVTDVVHLLAELVDNSLRASPPDTSVTFSFARAVDGGVLLEIADRGIGIPADDMRAVNERLASGGEVGPETARHMGLFVVSRLAKRHGLTVRLRSTFDTARNPGVTVSIHIPNALIVSQAARQDTGSQRKIPAAPVRTAIPAPAAPAPRKDGPQLPATRNGLPTRTPSTPPPAPSPASAGAVATASGTSLPRRQPGASGIAAGAGSSVAAPAAQSRDTVNVRGSGAMPKLPVRRPQAATSAAAAPETPTPESQPQHAPHAPRSENRIEVPPSSNGDDQSPVRHRYRTNSAKTASFFQSRIDPPPAEAAPRPGGGTPIFSDMVSDWLTDPTGTEGAPGVWHSAGDAGWSAAERISETPVEVDPEIGLPKRRPGDRLVPGTVEGAHNTGTLRRVRDPETIRANLSRHQQGVRNGRATRLAERNSIEGDR